MNLLDTIRQAHRDKADREAANAEKCRQLKEAADAADLARAHEMLKELPKQIADAVSKGKRTMLVMEVGKQSSLEELTGVAGKLYRLLVAQGLTDRLAVSIDNSGNWRVNNHFILNVESDLSGKH